MYVKSARFVISNTDIEKCPNNNLPEYAFIGRSNVGKSSLINSICNKKALAKTSSKPGKTQLINHYIINLLKDGKIMKINLLIQVKFLKDGTKNSNID